MNGQQVLIIIVNDTVVCEKNSSFAIKVNKLKKHYLKLSVKSLKIHTSVSASSGNIHNHLSNIRSTLYSPASTQRREVQSSNTYTNIASVMKTCLQYNLSLIMLAVHMLYYSKTCHKQPLRNRLNKCLNGKWKHN